MNNDAPPDELSTPPWPSEARRKQYKKVKLIDSLLRPLESLAFAQIAALYYYDTSTFLFLLRVLSQLLWVNSGVGVLRIPPQLPPVLVANLVAIATHLIQSPPKPDTGSRGYLHGGLIIDFVGQKPVGTWTLLALDVFIFGLQIIMLLAAMDKFRPPNIVGQSEAARDAQDLDAEEAGLLRPADRATEEEGAGENLSSENRIANLQPGSLHTLYDGEAICMEFNITQGLRTVMQSRATTPAMDDVSAGVIGNIIARLAAARSQTGSEG